MNKLSVAAMFLAFQGAAAYTISGRVVGVADGDTPNVLDEKTRTAQSWKNPNRSASDPSKAFPIWPMAVPFLSSGESGTDTGASWARCLKAGGT